MKTISILSFGAALTTALAAPATPYRQITFEERVSAQESIERVYERHRIWPEGNPARPAFHERMPRTSLEEKVRGYLRRSVILEERWNRPVTTAMLQAEIERMARDTKDPERLRELFRALGNDPVLIGECLARQLLTDRLLADLDGQEGQSEIARGSAERALRLPEVATSMPPNRNPAWIESHALRQHVDQRGGHVAVWTGAEMIVWGGGATTGGRYDPATDTWKPTRTGGDCPRMSGTTAAIWTGTEMVVWGGITDYGSTNSGARYDPATDTWRPTSVGPGCPTPRHSHTLVWTGSRMIVWGGETANQPVASGGVYDPASDTWQPTSLGPSCPQARALHTAVWTGQDMIVWGGGSNGPYLQSGGRYDPVSDTWSPTSEVGCPKGRWGHTATWAGSAMIVWGGWIAGHVPTNAGSRYDPVADTWTPTSSAGACPSARIQHTAVWTGMELIVWGGGDESVASGRTGGRYDPLRDIWTATPTFANCPSGRRAHTAVWTGTEMIIWGGVIGEVTNTGGRYDPSADAWSPTSTALSGPAARIDHTAIWTGAEMIMWGGRGSEYLPFRSGGRYDPATDAWTRVSTASAPTARYDHSVVWTGTEMIVWGGLSSGGYVGTGGRYDPALDRWRKTATNAASPEPRYGHTAVWTGTEMIVWGGRRMAGPCYPPVHYDSGGRYDPLFDVWRPTPMSSGRPSPRADHTAVWTGREMIVWGGARYQGCEAPARYADGSRYDPVAGTWRATSTAAPCPSARSRHSAVWTGQDMIVWGPGCSGGRYDPIRDLWRTMSSAAPCPSDSLGHSIVWTGKEMIVWGGYPFNDAGGRYDPSWDGWRAIPHNVGTPAGRSYHTAVWTGNVMIVWGGLFTSTGGILYPGTTLAGPP